MPLAEMICILYDGIMCISFELPLKSKIANTTVISSEI